MRLVEPSDFFLGGRGLKLSVLGLAILVILVFIVKGVGLILLSLVFLMSG